MTELPPNTTVLRSSLRATQQPEWLLARFALDRAVRQIPSTFRGSERVESPETEKVSIRLIDPVEAYDQEIKSKAQHIRDTDAAYASRIEVLKEQAESDGYSLNRASRDAFFEFLKKNPLIKRGRLVLMENGNLRASWKGGKEDHIGLQFINNRAIQYVIFTRREPQFPVSRVSGRDTLDGIKKQIEAFDLDSVLYI